MATQHLGKPDLPKPLSAAARSRLCAEWHALDEERLEFGRQATEKRRAQEAIEKKLGLQLEVDGVDGVVLAKWEFGYERVPGTFSAKDELRQAIGAEELQRLIDAVPLRSKFYLRARAAGRDAAKRRAA